MDKYRRILGVREDASKEEIRAVYEARIHKLQSEVFDDDPQYVKKKVKECREAYGALLGGKPVEKKAGFAEKVYTLKKGIADGVSKVEKQEKKREETHPAYEDDSSDVLNPNTFEGACGDDNSEENNQNSGGETTSTSSYNKTNTATSVIGAIITLFMIVLPAVSCDSCVDETETYYDTPYYDIYEICDTDVNYDNFDAEAMEFVDTEEDVTDEVIEETTRTIFNYLCSSYDKQDYYDVLETNGYSVYGSSNREMWDNFCKIIDAPTYEETIGKISLFNDEAISNYTDYMYFIEDCIDASWY